MYKMNLRKWEYMFYMYMCMLFPSWFSILIRFNSGRHTVEYIGFLCKERIWAPALELISVMPSTDLVIFVFQW